MPNRRHFLRQLAGAPFLLSLSPSLPLLLSRSAAQAAAAPSSRERILVVLQLTGGNDGLNSVVPFEDDAYARARPTLRLARAGLHRLDAAGPLGLHPRLEAFARLFHEGRLALLQGVGCAGLSRNHEPALRAWQTAAPDDPGVQTGWLGRASDRLWTRTRPAAPTVFVGGIPTPLGLNAASTVVPALRTAPDAVLDADTAAAAAAFGTDPATALELATAPRPPSDLLRHVRATAATARRHAARLEALRQTTAAATTATYPACDLGRDLRTVAQLIQADLGIRIFYAELGGGGIGGFDNHANQADNHGALLEQLATAVAAFTAELAAAGWLDRVLLLTFSEFGRTVAENGRRGTDHGAAGPIFAVGGAVCGGVHGPHPSLTDLEGGGLKHHTDFRAVYATALDAWLGLPSATVLGGEFTPVPFLAST